MAHGSGRLTYVPPPCRDSTSPSAFNRLSASRTVDRPTRYSAASRSNEGERLAGRIELEHFEIFVPQIQFDQIRNFVLIVHDENFGVHAGSLLLSDTIRHAHIVLDDAAGKMISRLRKNEDFHKLPLPD
jgi:hypothetical protein